MAATVIANAYRARLAKYHADGTPIAPFGFMAFGDGGHNANGTPKTPDPDSMGLARELHRVPLTAVSQPNSYTVSCEGRLEQGELVGATVSEAALLDTEGRLVAIKTFAPKIREADELYQVFIEPLF